MSLFVRVPSRRRPSLPWATPLLVLLAMTAFVWLANLDQVGRAAALLKWGTLSEANLSAVRDWSNVWTDFSPLSLVSAIFIHADWLHLLGNMLFLVIFGLPAERALGASRFLALFLVCGALSNLATVVAMSLTGGDRLLLVGASGAISALIAAFLLLFPKARLGFVLPLGLYLEFVRVRAWLMIGIWAFIQGLFAYVGPAFGMAAWWAHSSGFLFGVVIARLFRASVARRLREY